MKISVVIPTFRGARHIRATLESISQQTVAPSEVVVSDDCSDDETFGLVTAFARESPIAVAIHRHAPSGISANYLNAVAHASGDVLIVADQDDYWLPDRVNVILRAFEDSHEVSLVALDSEVVDENLRPLGTTLRGGKRRSAKQSRLAEEDDFRFFLVGARLDAHTLAFRSSVRQLLLETAEPPRPGLWFENLVANNAMSIGRLKYLPQALTLYRQHSAQHVGHQQRSLERPLTRASEVQGTRLQHLRASLLCHRTRALFASNEAARRLRLLEEFVSFQKLRSGPEPAVGELLALFRALVDGRYRRFTGNAPRALAKDVARTLMRASRS